MQEPQEGILRAFVNLVRGALRPVLIYLGTSPSLALHPRRFAARVRDVDWRISEAILYYAGAAALGTTIGWVARVEIPLSGIVGGVLDELLLLVLIFGGSLVTGLAFHWPLRWVGGSGPYEQAFKIVLYASGLLYPVAMLGLAVEKWTGITALALVVELATPVYYALMLSQAYEVGLRKIAALFVAMVVALGVPAALLADRLAGPTP